MMKPRALKNTLLWVLTVVFFTLLRAETRVPTKLPPEICNLGVTVEQRSGNAVITWSGGTPPFTVIRADKEDLAFAKRIEVIASAVRSRRFTDPRALLTRRKSYYQVYDSNSIPRLLEISPDAGLPGTEIRVHGVGFPSDCRKITVELAGVKAETKSNCSFTGFTFKVPLDAITGSIIVATPAGVADTDSEETEFCKGTPRLPRSW